MEIGTSPAFGARGSSSRARFRRGLTANPSTTSTTTSSRLALPLDSPFSRSPPATRESFRSSMPRRGRCCAATPSSSPPPPSKESEKPSGFWPSGAQPLPSSLGWPTGFEESFDLRDPGTKLGSGSYAQVYLGKDRRTGEEVAIKVIPKRRPTPPKTSDGDDAHPSFKKPPPPPRLPLDSAVVLQRLQREADLLSRVSGCGNVGALRAVHESEDAAFVVLAFVDGGDLEALVTKRREQRREEELARAWEGKGGDSGEDLWAAEERAASSSSASPSTPSERHVPSSHKLLFSEKEAAVVMFELLKALVALHYNSVLHGDIKPANIMLDSAATRDALSGEWSRPFLRLADFGLGRACATQQRVTGTRGTPVFMAPEVFRGNFGHKADVFAAGVTLHYLLSGRYPYFSTFEEVLKLTPRAVRARALAGEESWKFDGSTQQPFASSCSASCRDLLSSLLDRDERRRPTALEALGHPWFAEQLPPEPALLREAEERRRREEEERAKDGSLPFGLSSSSPAADALSPPPLALPPGVAAVYAKLAHSSMSACAECDMACCPLSGGRAHPATAPSLSRLVDGGDGFPSGGGEGCDLSSSPASWAKNGAPTFGVHELEPPEVDEH